MNFDRIYPSDFVNGPGCRVVLFVTGCLHKCEGCYNKSTWNARNGQLFTMNTVKELASHLRKSDIRDSNVTGVDTRDPQN
ncbi:4Fe-4S cluster-binding domain-containing protein, partial [Xanthomonas campestris]|uniref:4Fe-4S cluster-binding domain-containing protein n=1 Tax=Xanthomonas campestris TaxID=339 RepID=UPI00403A1FE1